MQFFIPSLKVIIKDKDTNRVGDDDFIASTSIPVYELIKYGEVSGWFQLNKISTKAKGSKGEDGYYSEGRISLQISYKPKYELAYRYGDV